MKAWYFLVWQWNKFETWQKIWMVAFFFFGAGIGAEKGSTIETVGFRVGAAIFAGLVLKLFIWDGIKSAWDRYNKEQEEIVSILKDVK